MSFTDRFAQVCTEVLALVESEGRDTGMGGPFSRMRSLVAEWNGDESAADVYTVQKTYYSIDVCPLCFTDLNQTNAVKILVYVEPKAVVPKASLTHLNASLTHLEDGALMPDNAGFLESGHHVGSFCAGCNQCLDEYEVEV